ncbi:MAG: DEAD/DEAH box helicase [Candidatus Aenigmatarchaeota archaeon]
MIIDSLKEYGIPEEFIIKLKESGIKNLNDPQIKSIKSGLFNSKNIVVSAPTASGKTLIATLAAIKKLKEGSRVIYLVPLIALATEKWQYYKKLFHNTGIKVAISTGDLDSSDEWLANYNLIILTTEKCDSLIRHGSQWLRDVGLVIVDEIHLLNDPNRGPTLEVTLTMLREIFKNSQIIGLSATINNVDEISKWLNAKTVKSNFRPVELYEGIYLNNKIYFFGREGYELNENLIPELSILENTNRLGKQSIYFVSTRRNAESLAEKIANFNKNFIGKNESQHLSRLSEEILNALETPTRQCKKLADCIRKGVAFHHAGLIGKQRWLIEESFRNGLLKVICATPTLAMGVSLPAFRVVVRDVVRYYEGYGLRHIPVLEYKQFVGRAGRPEYDKFGESILVAKTETEAEKLVQTYIFGEPEEIYSKLSMDPVLRMYILALVSSEFVNSRTDLINFFKKTFYAYQFGEITDIENKIDYILELLIKFGFIKSSERGIFATKIGKRVSELYLDPLTAYKFLNSLKKINPNTSDFSIIHIISSTLEMKPLLSVSSGEYDEINKKIAINQFLIDIPKEWEEEYDEFMSTVKTAMLLESWVEEKTEDEILGKFKVTPGELYTRLKNADWLLYSLNELGLLSGNKEILGKIRKLRIRMKYGVKEELLPLVRLEQVGRVRARKLFNNNIKTINELREISLERLSRIVGPKVAMIIKRQLGEEYEQPKEQKQLTLG